MFILGFLTGVAATCVIGLFVLHKLNILAWSHADNQ